MRFGGLGLFILMVILMSLPSECHAGNCVILVVDGGGRVIAGARVWGMIRTAFDGNIRFWEETDKSGTISLDYPGRKAEVFFWAEKDGWFSNTYPDKGPLDVPDAAVLTGNNKVQIRLVKKTSAQF